MRRTILILLMLCLILPGGPALAQTADPGASHVVEGEVLDMGANWSGDVEALIALIDSRPGLKEVHLYSQPLPYETMERLTGLYPDIFFGFTIRIAEHTIRTDQTAFSTLHNIRHIRQRRVSAL